MRKIKKNDTVIVTAGKELGKSGKVLRVIEAKQDTKRPRAEGSDRVVVEGLNIVKRHTKARGTQRWHHREGRPDRHFERGACEPDDRQGRARGLPDRDRREGHREEGARRPQDGRSPRRGVSSARRGVGCAGGWNDRRSSSTLAEGRTAALKGSAPDVDEGTPHQRCADGEGNGREERQVRSSQA